MAQIVGYMDALAELNNPAGASSSAQTTRTFVSGRSVKPKLPRAGGGKPRPTGES
jgi:hypothetical protein